jgi:hypothetical protein
MLNLIIRIKVIISLGSINRVVIAMQKQNFIWKVGAKFVFLLHFIAACSDFTNSLHFCELQIHRLFTNSPYQPQTESALEGSFPHVVPKRRRNVFADHFSETTSNIVSFVLETPFYPGSDGKPLAAVR